MGDRRTGLLAVEAPERRESGVIEARAHPQPDENPGEDEDGQARREAHRQLPRRDQDGARGEHGAAAVTVDQPPDPGETSPDTSKPMESAPTTQPSGHPVSAVIGPARTAGR